MNETLIFFKTVHLSLDVLIPARFSLVEETVIIFVLIFFISSNLTLEMAFYLRKQVNVTQS